MRIHEKIISPTKPITFLFLTYPKWHWKRIPTIFSLMVEQMFLSIFKLNEKIMLPELQNTLQPHNPKMTWIFLKHSFCNTFYVTYHRCNAQHRNITLKVQVNHLQIHKWDLAVTKDLPVTPGNMQNLLCFLCFLIVTHRLMISAVHLLYLLCFTPFFAEASWYQSPPVLPVQLKQDLVPP